MLGYIDSFPFDPAMSATRNRGEGSKAPESNTTPRDPQDNVEIGGRGLDSGLTQIENYAKAHKRGLLGLFGL